MSSRLLRFVVAAALAAALLGVLAAVAAAGSTKTPADSGGGGLVATTSTSMTVGTNTLVSTSTTPTTTLPGTGCTGVAVGTVTSTTPSTGTASTCQVAPPTTIAPPKGSAIAKRGMWIWELPATDGGSITKLIAQAKQLGIQTLYVKSGDGSSMWSQFNPTLVDELHAAGLHVCAWQFVYGNSPVLEAEVGAQAVADGAECLVIDAETQYQGRYVQAQQYITALRQRIGAKFPLALAGFPYVDYHPSFPYSVFLGPDGAQFNLPQMYWRDIGTTVDAVYSHTFEFNELYQRPIYPLGQIYDSPPVTQVRRFRSLGYAYKTTGLSWWDWQSAGSSQLSAISVPTGPIKGYVADRTVASLAKNALGDPVVWAQEHLWNTHERVTIDGDFGPATQTAVRSFQKNNGLPITGVIDPRTWTKLLKVKLPDIKWVTKKGKVVATVPGATTTTS